MHFWFWLIPKDKLAPEQKSPTAYINELLWAHDPILWAIKHFYTVGNYTLGN